MIKRRHRSASIIPLPSMADIAFLLLIFFITSSIMEMEREIPIALPEAHTSATENQRSMGIWINEEGRLFFQGKWDSMENLALHVRYMVNSYPDIRAFINADKNLPYEYVNRTLETLRDAGLYNIVLVSRKKGK